MKMKIREIRRKCGLTMKELGERVGVSESAISQYETGKRQPDYETLLRIAEYFGVTTDYLLGNESEEPSQQKERKVTDSELMFALWGNTENIDESDLEDVRRYAAFIKERKSKQ